MIPKSTEDTITVMLKEELERRGVRAEPFAEIRTPAGYRKPDLYCENGGVYIVEAKFKERDLWKAVAKIQNDYIKYHKVLNLNGGFAVLYPDELSKPLPRDVVKQLAMKLKFKMVMMFLPEDTRRNFHVVEGTLTQIAEELARQILTPPEYVEPSVNYIIETLRDIAQAITVGLKHLSGKQLEDLFGGRNVFENILQYEEGKYPEEELRLASAYILVNQLLFYHVLSRYNPDMFEEIQPENIATPSDLRKYFSRVLDVNYRAVFTYDVASRIPPKFVREVREIISAIEGLAPEKVGGDLLGTIFHKLIPFEIRKKVAAFYTNVMAAQLLADLAINKWDEKVADFACGSGGLLVAAYRRKKSLIEAQREFTREDHKRFVEEDLLGVDVMPFAANIAACHLALQSPKFFTNKVKIAVWDSTELEPGMVIPSIAHLKLVLRGQETLLPFVEDENRSEKGVVRVGLQEPEEIRLEKYNVIIMNPPFTRQERIPETYKQVLVQRFSEYSDYLHGQMSYYGYFLLLADRFLEEGGRLAFVLPAAFLRTRSLEKVRKLLAERYQIQYVITGRKRLNFSETTWRREILLVARKLKEGESKGDALFIALSSLPENISDADRIAEKIRNFASQQHYEDKDLIIRRVSHQDLEADLDWFRFIVSFFGEELSDLWEYITSSPKLKRFGDIYDLDSILKRGIETARGMDVHAVLIPRSEERAIRKEDYWIVRKVERSGIAVIHRDVRGLLVRIPKYAILPAMRTISNNRFMDASREPDFVVVRDFPKSEDFFIGERQKYRRLLPTWERYVKDRMGNLIILRRFPINAPGTIHLCYYASQPIAGPGMTWVANMKDEDARILTLWFNSSMHLAQILKERIEDVWLDIHKYVLADMLVLDPNSLTNQEKESLLVLFDALSNRPFPSLSQQLREEFEPRKKLDVTILKILGFNDNEAESLSSRIREMLREHFEALGEISK